MFARMCRHRAGRSLVPAAIAVVAQLLLGASPASAQSYNVTSRTDLSMGSGLEWVLIVDVNQDGRPDLVSANYNSNDMTVRLASGPPGTFGAPVSYPAGGNPYTVAGLDVNGDQLYDMAVANFNGGSVSIFLGNGTGAFSTKTDYATGPGCAVAALGDFNGDYIPDIVTANYYGNTVSVLFGNGSGGFQPHVDFPVGTNPNWVAVCDLNEDHKADLVTANAGAGTVSVLLGNGTGGFAPKVDYAVGNTPLTLTANYLNGDDHIDICTANDGSNSLSVLYGSGTGTLGGRVDLATPGTPVTVTSGDLNVDGRADLVVCNDVSNSVSWFLASGAGWAPRQDHLVGTLPYGVAIGDVNDDGEPDIVSANFSGNSVSVLAGDVPGGFRVGASAPPLAGPDQTETTRQLSSYAGKWVVLDMSAVWCGPCNAVGKETQQVYDTWANAGTLPFEYLTCLIDGRDPGVFSTQTSAQAWATRYVITRPVLHIDGHKWAQLYSYFRALGTNAYPTIAIINPAGVIKYLAASAIGGQDLVNLVANLAGVTAPTLVGPPPPPPPTDPNTVRAIWRSVSGLSATVAYGASSETIPLSEQPGGTSTDKFFLEYLGMPALGTPEIPGNVQVRATTDSTTGTELLLTVVSSGYYPFYGGTTLLPHVDPYKVTLSNLTWDDGLPRKLVSSTAKVSALQAIDAYVENPSVSYYLTSIQPAMTLTGSTLYFSEFDIGNVSGLPDTTFAFEIEGVLLSHVAQLGVDGETARPLAMSPAYPNPASRYTALRWSLPRAGRLELDVLDAAGRRVKSLRSGDEPAGPGFVIWDVRDDDGHRVAPGVYFARLRTNGEVRTTRIAVIR